MKTRRDILGAMVGRGRVSRGSEPGVVRLWIYIGLSVLALVTVVITGLQLSRSPAADVQGSSDSRVTMAPSTTPVTEVSATPVTEGSATPVTEGSPAPKLEGSTTPLVEDSTTSLPGSSVLPEESAAAVPQAPPIPPRAAFIGDSYTQGGGADPDAARWSTVAAAGMGWTEENYGRGGTGFVTTNSFLGCGLEYCPTYLEMVPEVVAAAPDVIVVAGGQNDFDAFAGDPEAVRNAISATYTDLRAGLPNALIVAVGPSTTWGADDLAVRFDAIVREAAASVNGFYVSLLDPYVFNPAVILADGHVNNDGHRAIADRVVATLTG